MLVRKLVECDSDHALREKRRFFGCRLQYPEEEVNKKSGMLKRRTVSVGIERGDRVQIHGTIDSRIVRSTKCKDIPIV